MQLNWKIFSPREADNILNISYFSEVKKSYSVERNLKERDKESHKEHGVARNMDLKMSILKFTECYLTFKRDFADMMQVRDFEVSTLHWINNVALI